MNPNFKEFLLKISKATDCNEIEIVQSLWSGYGKISRIELSDTSFKTLIVKNISLEKANKHPRGWNTDISHQRKVKSYEVETNWYKKWNQLCILNCKTPNYIGSFTEGNQQWIILEDLDNNFPSRKEKLKIPEVKVCLKWLANFHARFLNKKPTGLWDVGTYWHLETRPDEFEKIKHQKLKVKAHLIDKVLNNCVYKTIIHGDAKLANFCFSENGKEVAVVDFQYVGAGCGMKDVAYFLGSCLSSEDCFKYEKELLDFYFSTLEKALHTSSFDFKAIEKEWRELYSFAIADFTRFLLGWMPSHQKVNHYHLSITELVLKKM